MALETKKNLVGKMVPNAVPASQKKEEKIESGHKWKKVFGYLEGFKKSFAVLEKGGDKDKKKGGLFGGLLGMVKKLFPSGMLALIPAALMAMVGTLGIGVLVLGGILSIVQRVKDAFGGWAKAEAGEWGNIDKISGWIGGFLGGTGSGLWNALKVGGTWAIIGMTAGIAFGPPGIIIGGIIGAVIGGILGWIGGQKIAQWVDGTVKKLRSIFDLPEALSEEQKKLAEAEVTEAKAALMKAADNISMYKLELANEATTYQRRIELRRLIAKAEKVVEEKKDTIRTESRRLAESQLGDMDKTLKEQRLTTREAQLELQNAKALKNQAYFKTIWAKAIHGEGSAEHIEAMKVYDDRVLAVKDAKQNLVDQQAKQATIKEDRKKLRIELDKEHRTAMGNVRLFFAGETDWQNSFKSGWKNMIGSIKTWFKDNIYDPGSTGGPPGTDTPLRIFGIEMKWPKLSFPSWQEIKAALPWWLGGGGKEGGVTKVFTDHFKSWSWDLPKWADIKAKLPWWLGGGTDETKTPLKVFTDEFGTGWTFKIPTWATIKALIPTWLGGTKGGESESLKEKAKPFAQWTFTIPSWDDMKAMIPWWLGGTKGKKEDLVSETDKAPKEELFSKPQWMKDFTFTKPEWLTNFKITTPQWITDFEIPDFKLPAWMTKEITLPDLEWPDFGAMFKKYIYDPGTPGRPGSGGGTPMKIFGVALEFPDLSWSADDIWNALPMWIRDPIQFIKDNLPDLGKAAEKAAEVIAETTQQAVETVKKTTIPLTGGATVGDVAESVGSGVSTAWDFASTLLPGGGDKPEVVPIVSEQKPKMDQTLEGAQEAGFYEKKTFDWSGNVLSELNRKALVEAYEAGKVQEQMLKAIIKDKDLSEKDTEFMEKLLQHATTGTSLFVHDVHVEKAMKRLLLPMDFVARTQSQMLAAYGSGSGGGTTTVNNVTVAPSSSNSISSIQKTENTYGTVDPYTSAAGAYG